MHSFIPAGGMSISIGQYRISLDAREDGANLNFVSHAHSDHTGGVRKNNEILCSKITKDLVQTRTRYELKTVDAPEGVSLLDSGHMFGSKQLYVDSKDEGSIVYTGDYQMQKSPVAQEIEVRQADTLIIDSTYPFPGVIFEDKEEVIISMQHYIRAKSRVGSILFGAYSMGKAQEIIKICNDAGIRPIVDENIARISEVYSRHGIGLDFEPSQFCDSLSDREFGAEVWIASMHRMDKVRGMVAAMGRKVFTAIATGFAATQKFNTDVQFALSDHADFKQALQYIEMCNPKRIYTRGHGKEVFAANLKNEGYDAEPLKSVQAGEALNSLLSQNLS